MEPRKFSPKKSGSKTKTKPKVKPDTAFAPAKSGNVADHSRVHSLGKGRKCSTDSRGHSRPHGNPLTRIVIDASEGFIPLWAKNTILKWRFKESSMSYFKDPAGAKDAIRALLGEAILKWGKAAPVKFKEDTDVFDFEVVMKRAKDCDSSGCTLAEAFFPDPGRNKLILYPSFFEDGHAEQIDTLLHELGHVFGLRHFFAKLEEEEWASEIFGKHSKFSIMNYGELSKLKKSDQDDLAKLYKSVWSGKITEINGTPIKLIKAYHTIAHSGKDLGVFAPAAKRGFEGE